jgi:hypothetical protein
MDKGPGGRSEVRVPLAPYEKSLFARLARSVPKAHPDLLDSSWEIGNVAAERSK